MPKSTGLVKFFNPKKGYGFIIDDANNKEYFFHVTDLEKGQVVITDSKVEYELETKARGIVAVNVKNR